LDVRIWIRSGSRSTLFPYAVIHVPPSPPLSPHSLRHHSPHRSVALTQGNASRPPSPSSREPSERFRTRAAGQGRPLVRTNTTGDLDPDPDPRPVPHQGGVLEPNNISTDKRVSAPIPAPTHMQTPAVHRGPAHVIHVGFSLRGPRSSIRKAGLFRRRLSPGPPHGPRSPRWPRSSSRPRPAPRRHPVP